MKINITILSLLLVSTLTFNTGCDSGSQEEGGDIEMIPPSEYTDGEETNEETSTVITRTLPTQAELIKKHKVKVLRTELEEGKYNLTYYDESGQKTKEEAFYGGEPVTTEFVFELDKDGNILKESSSYTMSGVEYVTVNEYRYDENGRETWCKSVFDNMESEIDYTYDDNNNTRSGKDRTSNWISHFDEKGLKVKEILYDGGGQEAATVLFTNNNRGDLIKEESSSMGEELPGKTVTYEYNEKGLFTKKEVTFGESASSVEVYSYEYY